VGGKESRKGAVETEQGWLGTDGCENQLRSLLEEVTLTLKEVLIERCSSEVARALY